MHVDLDNFIKTIDAFAGSKFLLFEKSVKDFLDSLSKNDTVAEIIESSLNKFDYEKEFLKATESGHFKLPSKSERALAIIFCTLVEFDERRLNIYKFLETFFKESNINEAWKKFCEHIIMPFKNIMIIMMGGGSSAGLVTEEIEVVTEKEAASGKYTYLFLPVYNQINRDLAAYKTTGDESTILNAMFFAVDNDNYELYNVLKTCLSYAARNRKTRNFIFDLLNRFDKQIASRG